MYINDFVSDFVARINNGLMVKKPVVTVRKSKLIINIAKKLKRLGYITDFTESERELEVVINYDKTHKLKRMSTPGQRKFVQYANFPKVVGGRGFNIVTTSQGIKTNHECKTNKVGGELLFQIY